MLTVTPPPRRQLAKIRPTTRSGWRNPNSRAEPLPAENPSTAVRPIPRWSSSKA